MAKVRSQGTEVYLLDATNTGNEVRKINQVTAIPTLSDGPANEIDVTNLDSVRTETINGLPSGQELTFPLQYDPSDEGHQELLALKGSASEARILVCLSESATQPTYSSGYTIPTDRTVIDITGPLRDFAISADLDDVVTAEVTIRTGSGFSITEAA